MCLQEDAIQVQDLVLDLLKEKQSQKQVLRSYKDSQEPLKVKNAVMEGRDDTDLNSPPAYRCVCVCVCVCVYALVCIMCVLVGVCIGIIMALSNTHTVGTLDFGIDLCLWRPEHHSDRISSRSYTYPLSTQSLV